MNYQAINYITSGVMNIHLTKCTPEYTYQEYYPEYTYITYHSVIYIFHNEVVLMLRRIKKKEGTKPSIIRM